MKIERWYLAALVFVSGLSAEDGATASLEKLRSSKVFIRIADGPGVKIDLKYATVDNFMQQNLYGKFNECYLHSDAMQKFKAAQKILADLKPGYSFLIFDCLRPRSVQRLLWAKVKGTKQQPYVAEPEKGSVHNFGFAIDLSLSDAAGKELDMGTPFDSFSKKSEPRLEEEYTASGDLTAEQLANRKLLRRVMTEAGFAQQVNEWWHYNAVSSKALRKKKYAIFE